MQDWLDNRLDREIAAALRSTNVTPRQKARAWEQVRARAATQVPLSPAAPQPSPGVRLARACAAALVLLFDDRCYDRALQKRYVSGGKFMLESPLRNVRGGIAT